MRAFDHSLFEHYRCRLESRTQLRRAARLLASKHPPTHALPLVRSMDLRTLHIAHRIATGNAEPQPFRNHDITTVSGGSITYMAPRAEDVMPLMRDLLARLAEACAFPLSDEELMFNAAQLHTMVLCIHPYSDGNGRLARLLERWFIAHHRGPWAWHLDTENYYRAHRDHYCALLAAIGPNWPSLRWDRAIPFLLMLPAAIAHQVDT